MKHPFRESEITNARTMPDTWGGPDIVLFDTPISTRENWQRNMRGEALWLLTGNDLMYFMPECLPDNVARGGTVEARELPEERKGGLDMFGINWVYVPTVGGSMEDPDEPHTFEDIEDWEKTVRFPDIDAWDWEGCAKANAEYLNTDLALHSTIYTGFFERLISFTGFENAAMDLIDEDCQPYVHALFGKLADLYIEIIRRLHRYFNVEIVEVHDDWGNQRSLMFSVETHREMLLPYMKRIAEAAHAEGVFIEQHSCGKIESLMPNIIESGVDTWRGQSNVIDKKWCVDNYGDRFRFAVDIRPGDDVRPEEIMPLAKRVIEQYHGKDVWVWMVLGRNAPEGLDRQIYEYIRSLGHI